MASKILVLNGPNLNLLGTREPDIYGNETLADIEVKSLKRSDSLGLQVEFRQSNTEGQLVDWVQEAQENVNFLIVNAGAYTHTSVALLDALRATNKPKIEIHISNIYSREDYRRKSITSEAVNGVICGFGENGYVLAIDALTNLIYNKV